MRLGLVALGALALTAAAPEPSPLFVVLYRLGPSWQVGVPMARQPKIGEHAGYMKKLFDDGHTFAAGPTTDAPGGIIIMHARDMENAKAIVAADPAVSSGLFLSEVHAWAPRMKAATPLP